MGSVNLTTHVSGLASGMDTETIVNNMMKVNRIPLDKLYQSKTINSWKTDAYREINTKIASFRDAMQDLRLEGTFESAQKVSTNDSRIDISMATKSTLLNFTISKVKLATPAKGTTINFDTTIKNSSAKLVEDGLETNKLSFSLNGTQIEIPETSTFDEAVKIINAKSKDTNVIASNVGGSLVFSTIKAGAGQEIKISGTNAQASSILKITDGTYSNGSDVGYGEVVINGTSIQISSNTFTFDGVQINLKQDIPEGSNVAVNVVPDTDKMFDKIKTFVDKYNELIKDLNDKVSEKKYRDYPPLTDEQKKDMKDDDIKLWEEKAKSGLLANDPTIRQFLTQIRTSINEIVQGVNGNVDTLKEIGISTSTNYKDNGKLTLDETKLKSMLSTNLTDVQKLFAAKFDTGNLKDNTLNHQEKYARSGLAVRVYERIGDVLDKLKVIAGAPGTISIESNLAKEAATYDERIAKLQDSLNTTEQNLWKKFNAMEEAMQKLNSQSSWLYQQLGQ